MSFLLKSLLITTVMLGILISSLFHYADKKLPTHHHKFGITDSVYETTSKFPLIYSLKDNVPPPIAAVNQGGCCLPSAAIYAMEYLFKEEGINVTLNRSIVYWDARVLEDQARPKNDPFKGQIEDDGTLSEYVIRSLKDFGTVDVKDYPEMTGKPTTQPIFTRGIYKILEAGYIHNNMEDIKTALVNNHPVCMGLMVPEIDDIEGYINLHNGIWPKATLNGDHGHEIMIIGWNDNINCFEIEDNNLSAGGFEWLPYNYLKEGQDGMSENQCFIITQVIRER